MNILSLALLLAPAAAATGAPPPPLWARGSYAKLSFAADLSATFEFDAVSMAARPPPLGAGNATAQQRSGVDASLGAYDELAVGPYAVRYYTKLDAFEFQRAYPLPVAPPPASRAPIVTAEGASCADLSGVYRAPGTGVGTGPGGVDVVSTISQEADSCFFSVGGESLCNGANGTVDGSAVNGTGGCLLHKQGVANATHLTFGGAVWERVAERGFPTFEVTSEVTSRGPPAAAPEGQVGCIGWEDIAFAPAAHSFSLSHCQTDGPVVAFHNRSRATFVFSALDHFTTNVPATSATGITVATQGAPIPAGTTMSTLLLARPGPSRAMRAWGSTMRQRYNTTRSRAAATTGLSYWDDNQAGYSYWSVDNHLDIWGQPEAIFVDLLAAYAKHGIKFQSWETDQNFLGSMCPLCNGNDGFGWCWKDVSSWNTTLFPSGEKLSQKLGGLPMVFCELVLPFAIFVQLLTEKASTQTFRPSAATTSTAIRWAASTAS